MPTGVIVAIIIVVIITLAGGGYFIYTSLQDRPAQNPSAVDALAQQLATDTTTQTQLPDSSAPIVSVRPTATQVVSPPASQINAQAPSSSAVVAITTPPPAPSSTPPTPIPASVVNTMPLKTLQSQIDSAYAIVMSATSTPEAKKAAYNAVPPPGALDASAKYALQMSSDPDAYKASYQNIKKDIDAYKRKIMEMHTIIMGLDNMQKAAAAPQRPCGKTAAQAAKAGCVAVPANVLSPKGTCPWGQTKYTCPNGVSCAGGAVCIFKNKIPAGKKMVDFVNNLAFFK